MLRHADVIRYKVRAELRAEMDRAYFGLIWWVAEPILYMAVFYVVFSVLFERGGPDFVPFLLIGLVSWRWFDASIRSGAKAITSNGSMMSQVHVPKLVFPLVTVVSNTVKFFIILVILLGFLLLYGIPVTHYWLALPLVIAVQFLLVTTTTSLLSLFVPFFPDANIFITNAMTLMLFLSGVFFSADDLAPAAQTWFYINPMATLIQSYRDVLLNGEWPAWGLLAAVVAGSALVGALALWMARRYDRTYPKMVL